MVNFLTTEFVTTTLTTLPMLDATSLINNVGKWVLGLLLLIVGFALIARGVGDFWEGFKGKGKSKDWGAIVVGIVTGAVGAIFLYWGADQIISTFKNVGDSVPTK
ncbi:hypothetical protein [Ligilactobacillus equi]|uniref:Uncharacterized protein n=1 Tax=Ligilactobacillus equi DSM 15833 = JCM 10991 TaxID=1423740 RepID=A0A0R1TK31_9LACO|nr:hypothetical protein [Ligilactobacillus equi]KRL79202.1 hypothetical protein FC36_GL000855 [Ligilactobacillus equi DSM 15833 = JCM 10991]